MLLATLLIATPDLQAQRLRIVKGFKVLGDNYEAPHELQPRWLLQGGTAQPLEGDTGEPVKDGRQLLKDVTLQTYQEDGQRVLLVRAPECIYDPATKSAQSPGPLDVQTGDGKFSIRGEGFCWQGAQSTNSSLIISNQVRTLIAPEMMQGSTNKAAAQLGDPKTGPIEIRSERFDYSRASGIALYTRKVRASGTNQMSLTSEKLVIKLPVEPRQLQSIRAEENVAVNYGEVQATGREGVYSADTGLVRLSGEPAWRVDQHQGRADVLTIDRTNKIFRADGHGWFSTPAHNLSLSGLLAQTNQASAAPQATNHFVDVLSDSYEFRTNWALFSRDVQLTERTGDRPGAKMSCGSMHVSFRGSNQLDTLVARTNVWMRDATNWLRSGTVVLTGTNGVLEATESPAWGSGAREGKGSLIRILSRENGMLVKGNASLKMPSGELAGANLFRSAEATNKFVVRLSTNDLAEIFCEEYSLRPQNAEFRGGVYATHPRMNWVCETLSIKLSPSGGQMQNLLAEGGVSFQLAGEKGGQLEGTADKAVYTYGVERGATNDLLTLTGSPATLKTGDGTVLRNPVIILDRVHNQLRTPGDYTISGTAKLPNTNAFRLPKAQGGR